MAEIDPNQAFRVATLAKKLDCSTRHLYNEIASGRLKAFPIGEGRRGLRIKAIEVERWQERKQTKLIEAATALLDSERTERRLPTTGMIKALASG